MLNSSKINGIFLMYFINSRCNAQNLSLYINTPYNISLSLFVFNRNFEGGVFTYFQYIKNDIAQYFVNK